ncbi:hypothetical protein [Helicobacter sp. NHP22-001]|uniref:hypothetical protein n=1 Tax=Helicobacter sp. NHP22-001 TaxID=3040202 RepID=UPI0025571255|nr:hypothetical protein [Helicobacter sp. NHP22-001]
MSALAGAPFKLIYLKLATQDKRTLPQPPPPLDERVAEDSEGFCAAFLSFVEKLRPHFCFGTWQEMAIALGLSESAFLLYLNHLKNNKKSPLKFIR